MGVLGMVEFHPPLKRAGGQVAVFGVGARSGKLNHLTPPVQTAVGGGQNTGRGSLVTVYRQRGTVAGDAARRIGNDHPEANAVVSRSHRRESVAGRRCPGDAGPVTLPLVRQSRAGGPHRKRSRPTRRSRLTDGLGRNGRNVAARVLHPPQLAVAARGVVLNRATAQTPTGEVVQAAIRSRLYVDGPVDARCKVADGVSISRVQRFEVAVAIIGEEIFTRKTGRKLICRRVVKGAARNGAAHAVIVSVNGVLVVGRERLVGANALDARPAVVFPRRPFINFLVGTLPYVVDENSSGAGLHDRFEGIAET